MDPFQLLPPELLSRVIELTCTATTQSRKDLELQRVALSCISKHWLDNVLSTPSIWSYVFIDAHSARLGCKDEITLSGSVPLHIRIAQDVDLENNLDSQLSTLLGHSARWGSFGVCHPNPSRLSRYLLGHLPQLQELSIIGEGIPESNFQLDAEMPKLRVLVVHDVEFRLGELKLSSLSSLDLRHLRLSPVDAWKVVSILEDCRSLEAVTLIDIFGRDVTQEISQRPRPLMPKLRQLVVSEPSSPSVLPWIVAPSLQMMKVTTTSRPIFFKDLEMSFTSVEDLEITDFSASMSALRSILLATLNVSRLHVRHRDFHDSFTLVPDLVLQHGTWTNLADLTLHGVFSINQLRNAAYSHRSSLKRVGVHCLDLGLSPGSLRKEYDEHEDALEWMHQHFEFRVDHTEYVSRGDRYRSFLDQMKGRPINCKLHGCPKFPKGDD